MKPRITAVVGLVAVLSVGAETFGPAHKDYDLPHSHTEVPDGAPSANMTIVNYATTTNVEARMITFDGSSRN